MGLTASTITAPEGPWDALLCSEDKCRAGVKEAGEGAYLVRRSPGTADAELLVLINGHIMAFEINGLKNGGYHCRSEIFRSLPALIKKFSSKGVPGPSGQIPLAKPCGLDLVHKHSHYLDVFNLPPWYLGHLDKSSVIQRVMQKHTGYFAVIAHENQHSYQLIVKDGAQPSLYTLLEQREFKIKFGNIVFSSLEKAANSLLKKGVASAHGGALKLALTPPKEEGSSSSTGVTSNTQPSSSSRGTPEQRQRLASTTVWFAGPVSKSDAEKYLLSPACESGAFMFHSNPDTPTSFYISYNHNGRLARFKIVYEKSMYHFGKEKFPQLKDVYTAALEKGLLVSKKKITLDDPVAHEYLIANNLIPVESDKKGKFGTLRNLRKKLTSKLKGQGDGSSSTSTTTHTTAPEGLGEPSISSGSRHSDVLEAGPLSSQPATSPTVPLSSMLSAQSGKATSSGRATSPLPPPSPDRKAIQVNMPPPTAPRADVEDAPPPLPPLDGRHRRTSHRRDPRDVVSELGLNMPVTPMDVAEFKRVPRKYIDPETLPKHGLGPRLNRFRDILPNPATRVCLPKLREDPTLEYINANFVRGYGNSSARTYLAAQAPMSTGVFNFWRMIWETNVQTMIMATGFVEKGKNKCAEYFTEQPTSDVDPDFVFGPPSLLLSVQTLSKEDVGGGEYEKRTLRLFMNGQQRDITHYWHTSWLDHDVPKHSDGAMNTTGTLKLLQDVRSHRLASHDTGPLLVHCSAGIGRTGTLIVIDHAIAGIERGDVIDLNKIISELREDRMALVQHVNQYKFCYQACVEYARQWSEKLALQQQSTSGRGVASQAVYGSTEPIYAVASSKKEQQRMRKSSKWKMHSQKGDRMVFSLQSTIIPEEEGDNVAVFKPQDDDDGLKDLGEEEKAEVILEESDDISSKWWFRSNFTRTQVDELLSDRPVGCFVVRNSSKPGCYAMSVCEGSKIVNMLISPVTMPDGSQKYKLGNTSQTKDLFPTVELLVESCLKSGVQMTQQSGKLIKLRGLEEMAEEEDV